MIAHETVESHLLRQVRIRQDFLDQWHKNVAATVDELHLAEQKKDLDSILRIRCKLLIYTQDILGAHSTILMLLHRLIALDQEGTYKQGITIAMRNVKAATDMYNSWFVPTAQFN